MRKIISIVLVILIILFIVFYNNIKGVWPLVKTPVTTIEQKQGEVSNNLGLNLPSRFSIYTFASNVPGARIIIFDNKENLWVSQTNKGMISRINIKNGKFDSQEIIFRGLKNPHGLAFDPDDPNILYIAEETKISKVSISPQIGTLQKILDLPKGGRHYTRTINFGPDGKLYVSIGSDCDTCYEPDARYSSIYSLNKDGTNFKQLAKGLRNTVFFVFNENDKKIWATDMGRDNLGDNIPPDELNIIDPTSKQVLNYGWPICYGKNIHDTKFDKNTYIRNPCMEPLEQPSFYDFPAHSANLGLVFVPNNNWPNEYAHNLLVAFHGSWNRSIPTGYKIIRLIVDSNEKITGQEDFISGFISDNGVIGRPVDVIFNNNDLYISDDFKGAIYKVSYNK